MKMKITSHVKVIMFFCITLLLSNCQNEENSSDQLQDKIQTVSIDEVKNFLKGSKGNPLRKSTNSELEHLDFDKITQEKINGSDQLLTVIPFATNNDVEYSRVLLLKNDNEINSVIFSMYPDENSAKGSFSGNMFSYSLEGDFINGFRVKEGVIISRFVENNDTLNSESDKTAGLTRRRAIQLKEVVVRGKTIDALDVYGASGMFGDGFFGGGIGDSGIGNNYYSWDVGDAGSGITAPTAVQIVDELTGKAKCLNDLLNKNGDSFVKKLLANFEGKSEFDIKIVSVDKIMVKDANGNLVESNGETTYNNQINKTLINIAISTSRSNFNSSLDAARTILHEYVHADIVRKLYSTGNIPEKLDFKIEYNKYGNDHGTMAALYLSSMKEALKEFNKKVLPNDYKNYTDYYGEEPSDAFYEALAWSGLKENNVQAWTNLTSQQQQAINDLASRVTKMSKTCP